MRPSSIFKSMPSRATVVSNTLRSPRASIEAIGLALLSFCCFAVAALSRGGIQFFLGQAKPLDGRSDAWPLVIQKFLPFAFVQEVMRAGPHEHAKTASGFDQLLVDQFLVSLEDGKGIDSIFRGDIAHRREG